jgi:hypothetical protein
MAILSNDELTFRFPEVHPEAVCRVSFQRTLRIPDDNREYPLPAGLGRFPVGHVEDHADRVPAAWRERGGVFLPMYQAEALWISFHADYPCAIKIAAGKINAVSGEPWAPGLSLEPQNYLVVPGQPWLDGFSVGEGRIRQFVAMPLGAGYTAEEQLTGAAEHGGLQIAVCPMTREHYERLQRERRLARSSDVSFCEMMACDLGPTDMGLAPGGLMRQAVYEDTEGLMHGLKVWNATAHDRCFVHLLNALQYRTVTGKAPTTAPITAEDYAAAGIPWFEYYGADQCALPGSPLLAGLDGVAAKAVKLGQKLLGGNGPVTPGKVVPVGPKAKGAVQDGTW